jgi:hypothetical protein
MSRAILEPGRCTPACVFPAIIEICYQAPQLKKTWMRKVASNRQRFLVEVRSTPLSPFSGAIVARPTEPLRPYDVYRAT